MKTIETFFVAVFLTALSLSVNAQQFTNSLTANSVTNNSAVMTFGINTNDTAYVRLQYGHHGSVNEFWTQGYMLVPGIYTFSINLNSLSDTTSYDCYAFVYSPTTVSSNTVTFTTLACSYVPPAISSTFINSCSMQLNNSVSGLWNLNGTSTGVTGNTFTATVSGSYTLTASNGTCTGTSAPIVVSVNEIAITTNGNQTICAGDFVTLTASASGSPSYIWSNSSNISSINVSPSSTMTFTVTVTESGCSNTANIKVTVNKLPDVSVTPSTTSVCINAVTNVALHLIPSDANVSGNGVTGNSFSASLAGVGQHIITASYTDANGCFNDDAVTIDVLDLPIVNGISYDNQILIIDGNFPYPIQVTIGSKVYQAMAQSNVQAIFVNVSSLNVGDMILIQSVEGGCFIMTTYSSVEELLLGENIAKDKDTRIFDIQGQVVNVKNKSELAPGIYIQGGRKFIVVERNF